MRISQKILTCVLAYFKERNASYYHKISHEGYLRHLLVRRAENTGEILVNLVTTSQEEWDLMPLVQGSAWSAAGRKGCRIPPYYK